MPEHEIIEKAIRKVADFPKPGVLFYDITGILVNPKAFSYCIDRMESCTRKQTWTRWRPSNRAGSSSPRPSPYAAVCP